MVALIPGIVLAAAAGALALREPDPKAVPTLQEVSDRTISPYCAPLTLSECPSTKAYELREVIGEKIRAGWNNERIDAWLSTNFGAWLVGGSAEVAAEIFPALAILSGALLVAAYLSRRYRAQPENSGNHAPSVSDLEDVDQIRRELAQFRMGSE